MSQHKFAIYLGNLRPNVRARYHKQNIVQLLNAIQISVDKHAIQVFYDEKDEPAYAFVDLDTERDQRYAIQTLSDLTPEETEDFENFEYDSLIIDGEELRVSARNDKTLKKYGRHKKSKIRSSELVEGSNEREERSSKSHTPRPSNLKHRHSKGVYRYAHKTNSPRANTTARPDSPTEDESTNDLIQSLRPEKTYQEEWLERMQTGGEDAAGTFSPLELDLSNQKGDDNSSSGLSERGSDLDLDPVELPERFYVRGKRIPNTESRTLEFKSNGGKMKKYLRKDVSKYVVAFLNSAGGTLMLGIDDQGIVHGHVYSRKEEDTIRLVIDETVCGIQPLVRPDMYSVEFVHVQVDGKFGRERVVEIAVEQGIGEKLYTTRQGDVYVRRDGSVQGPLKAADVQQWTEGRYDERLRRNQVELEFLRDEHSSFRDQMERQNEFMEYLKARKTKVCTII